MSAVVGQTHKATNPIKLIIQVLNYTRKHSFPERRSAFTYLDEEQPARIDFGKDKFGGPFTEEEVEDVKTEPEITSSVDMHKLCYRYCQYEFHKAIDRLQYKDVVLNIGMKSWLLCRGAEPPHTVVVLSVCPHAYLVTR